MGKEKETKTKTKTIKNFSIQLRGKFALFSLIGGIVVLSICFSVTDSYTSMIFSKGIEIGSRISVGEYRYKHQNLGTIANETTTSKENGSLPIECDFTTRRSDKCEIDGDVRIHGTSAEVFFFSDKINVSEKRNWRVRPYTRKGDDTMMLVREISINGLAKKLPPCGVNHTVPAIILSTKGYCGNYWHDFNDILVPLFITARQFNGEVQLFITQLKSWYIQKYENYFKGISKYGIIELDQEDKVHCFPKAIVGLNSHKDFSIDPSRAPNGYSMVDFTKFMRGVYSLKRDFSLQMRENPGIKPRIYIMPRKVKRMLTNMEEIIPMAEELGFEVVVEGDDVHESTLGEVAQVINSCDVMVGAHGAGFTNMVFLPTNAVVIQIVPLGKLDKLYHTEFGLPATDMKLKYISYNITEEENSLIDRYPRDHPVFTDSMSIHKSGWDNLARVFMKEQNVKLDVQRFKPILERAIKHLKGENDS